MPDYILETSWEVCNKVGGIYTVLSTKAKTIVDNSKGSLIFFGPCFDDTDSNPLFTKDNTLFSKWRNSVRRNNDIIIKIGRWNIPGNPIVVLVDFKHYISQKAEIYTALWRDFGVDSLHAYGDYDESMMFAYGVAKAVESFYRFHVNINEKVVFQAHEWMTGLAVLYLQKHLPQIATIFTTHATSVGRSIASNGKPLYGCFKGYNGDQMAAELNIQSKHSIEKQTAKFVDCFTTVSDITARECTQLLEREPDVLLLNGFENDFVPQKGDFEKRRKQARKKRLAVANALMGTDLGDDTIIIGIGGRYEVRNKGIDVFLEAMHRLDGDERLQRDVVAFIDVPAWMKEPRTDLLERLSAPRKQFNGPLDMPYITHRLYNEPSDAVLNTLRFLSLQNNPSNRVKVIFAPSYLTGSDGIFSLNYYDTLIGNDLNVYPSYYEPWGYTPMESAAFSEPTITTSLAGFGLWVNQILGHNGTLDDGVKVINRNDGNYFEVADVIKETIINFALKDKKQVRAIRKNAATLVEKALWKHFISYYYKAYALALDNAAHRNNNINLIK